MADLELAAASKHLVITCERLVPHDEIAREPHKTQIPYFIVDAVCEVPFGAFPGTMPNEYFSDEPHLKEWMSVEKDPEAMAEFMEKNIYGCKDFQDYIDLNGGMEKMKQLRRKEFMLKAEEV